MPDEFTEVVHTGYFSRIGNAIFGVLFGVVFFVAAIALLFWNEGRAVHTAKMLREGAASVISVSADSMEPPNDGKLVHFTGSASGEKLTDPLFHTSADGIQLSRVVQMYQWKETEKVGSQSDNIGGGQTSRKTYTYDKIWSADLIDSSNFHEKEYVNPRTMRVTGSKWAASQVKVGAFSLPPELINRVDNYGLLPLSDTNLEQLPHDLQGDAAISNGLCYISGQSRRTVNPGEPQIGDLKVSVNLAPPGPVSVVARQTGNSLDGYPTRAGGTLELLYVGNHPASEMFATEQRHNSQLSWILRGVGFVVVWFGLLLILNPLAVAADVVGIIGRIVGSGIAVVSFLVAVTLSSITVAVAWIVYRPLIGIAMLAVATSAVIFLITRSRKLALVRS
jgi:hypothetical protein